MLKYLSYYIIFTIVLQLILLFFGFGTNFELYKFSLMLGILVLNALLLSTFKSQKLKKVKVKK
jgi:hypothetical protein